MSWMVITLSAAGFCHMELTNQRSSKYNMNDLVCLILLQSSYDHTDCCVGR